MGPEATSTKGRSCSIAHCWIAGGLILLAGGILRAYRTAEQVILDDEWHALNVVQDQGFGFIFSHFGHADHSIPMALLFEWLSRTVGLGELAMRLPSIIAGTLLIVVFPLLMRPWLSRGERVLAAALLAFSPLLIHFSRIARPYALLALLASASLPLAWRWWKTGRSVFGVWWYLCACLAGWLNPVSLVVTTAPFLWFGAEALLAAGRGNLRPLRRLSLQASAIAVTLGALLYLPVSNDFQSLAIKSGLHEVGLETLAVTLSLASGSGHRAIVWLVALAALAGLLVMRGRDRAFGAYLAVVALAAGIVVTLTGAEWIKHGIVLARYLIGLLPVYLALAAVGAYAMAGRLQSFFRWPPLVLNGFTALLVLLLIAAGPLRDWGLAASRFVPHLARQFDYDLDRNPFVQLHAGFEVPGFYADIAAAHPAGDAIIVAAPWDLESTWNTMYLAEPVHRQRIVIGFVEGVCADRLYGELRPGEAGLAFRNFVRLSDVLDGRVEADYLVLQRQRLEGASPVSVDLPTCESAARKKLGEPWRDTPAALVFRLGAAP